MKKFFKSFGKLVPHVTALLMILTAVSGHFLTGTISLFEFWTLLGLSQIISILGSFSNAIEINEETKTENTQINS
jgi:hypothetical protein